MNKGLYWALQWTWGLPQNLAGACVALACRRCPHTRLEGALVTEWRRDAGLSLGMFVFVPATGRAAWKQQVVVHEYGHTLQSIVLGPAYLPTVGLCSALWANTKKAAASRARSGRSYYDFWTERWANRLGETALGKPTPR